MIIYNANATPLINVEVDDTSYRYRAIMQADELNLEFSLAEHYELPVGAYCIFEAQKYVLMELSDVTVHHRRNYEYVVRMYGPLSETANYIIHNPVDHRIKFDLTARPEEHLALIVANLNERDGAGTWSVGSYVTSTEKTISYNSTTCRDALSALAQTFETEFEVVSYTINLRKVEYHKDTPLPLSYGKGNGLRPGVKRISSSMPVGKVYVQGGSRNISLSEYGASTLHLPTNETFRFDGTGFVNSGGVLMHTDSQGYYAYIDGAASNATELALDLSDIYPKRIGTVSGLRFEYKKDYFTYSELIAEYPNLTDEDWDSVQVDFYDSTIPATLDYAACQMTNDEPLTVIFQSGNLVGREFQVNFKKEASDDDEARPANRFEMIKTDIDGVNMPTRNFLPAVNDTYAVFNCNLPSEYINDSAHKTGAEWDALKEAARVLYENKDPKVAYRGDLDPLFAKADWINVGDYLKCGSYISFSDQAIQSTALLVRIVGVRQYVNNKECPTIEFSNELISPSLSSSIKQLQANEAHVEELNKQSQRYAQRSFRNAKETMGMLIDAKLKGYTEAISPIAIQTMQMLVGDESLQFKFWQNAACTIPINPVQPFNKSTKTVTISHAYLQHMTLGIDSIMPAEGRQLSDYKVWEMQEHTSAVMSDPDARYYVYAKCDALNDGTSHNTGQYVFSETAIGMDEVSGYYHFLIGILNSEMDGDRDFASLYGFTEILPGQITTDKIRSSDGNSWFDMTLNQMRFGDANKSFSWNLNNTHEFFVDGGVIKVRSGNGSVSSMITCDRGAWVQGTTYYYGDEVYTADGARYVYINDTPSTVAPPNASYWALKQIAGSNGYNTAIIYLYKRAATAPSIDWATDLTYSFTNKALTSVPSGWSQTIPAFEENKPLYVTAATAMSRENTDTIAYTEWSSPVELSEDGKDGLNSATVFLYQRGATAPSKPSATLTYTFATGILSGTGANPLAGWSQSIPSGTDPCWVIQATAVSSGASDTIAASEWSAVTKFVENGQRGPSGAKLRGPTRWEATTSYESGTTTDFQDIVMDGEDYFLCIADITGSSSNPSPRSDSTHWLQSSSMPFVATEVFFAKKSKINNLVVDYLYTTDPNADDFNPISIHGETITIADSDQSSSTYKKDLVTITSKKLDISSSNPLYPSLSSGAKTYSFTAPGSADLSYTINIGTVTVAGVNNTVTLPKIRMSYQSKTSGSSILCYCQVWLGDRAIDFSQLTDSTSSIDLGGGSFNLPQGSHIYRVVLSGSFYSEGSGNKSVVVNAAPLSSTGSVVYSSDFRVIATNGMQFSYGYEGIKITPIVGGEGGAKVIQSGNEYNMLGGDVYNSSSSSTLVAPKRIVVCDNYPNTMDSDVLYIKVSSS